MLKVLKAVPSKQLYRSSSYIKKFLSFFIRWPIVAVNFIATKEPTYTYGFQLIVKFLSCNGKDCMIKGEYVVTFFG
jgi:hypothetical protein